VRKRALAQTVDEALAYVQEERRRYPAIAEIDEMLDEAAVLVQAARRLNTASSVDRRSDILIRSQGLLVRASEQILSWSDETPEARSVLAFRIHFLQMVDEHWALLVKAHGRHQARSARARRRRQRN
jgi:hypothetical protein